MSKRFIISEEERKHIKKLHNLQEQSFIEKGIEYVLNSILNGDFNKSDKDETTNDNKLNFDDNKSEPTKTKTPVDFKEITKKVIDRIEGGYYNPVWHYKPAMGKSGETMFGIDRKHGGSLNTGPAGTEFWNIIDKNKNKSVWTHGYRGGALAEKLTDLVVEIMRPHYESLAKKYLSPEALEIVNSSKPLLFHFIYASWNGPGFFKKFAESINKKVEQGVTSEEDLQDVALDSRRNSAASGSVNKIEKIFGELA